jgi:CheY-like chemotaxis protein
VLDGRHWQVDLILTDMVMPGMDGREFVRRIRARRPELPVLCMSGHMEWGASTGPAAAEPWGPERLLAKPFAFSDLLRRVRDALGGATVVG